jgi:hypothetical protein
MQIGEVAKRSSLTVDAIRFYEKRKLLAFCETKTLQTVSSVRETCIGGLWFGTTGAAE